VESDLQVTVAPKLIRSLVKGAEESVVRQKLMYEARQCPDTTVLLGLDQATLSKHPLLCSEGHHAKYGPRLTGGDKIQTSGAIFVLLVIQGEKQTWGKAGTAGK
jgi:hypothetical protein